MAFVVVAVITGLVIQCGTPAVEHILDAGLDGSPGDTGIRDARAQDGDLDIPEGCNCEEPLTALNDRLEELEGRLAEASERLTELEGGPGPEPDSFSMLVGFDGEEPHALLVPRSNVAGRYMFHHMDESGDLVDSLIIGMGGFDPVARSAITLQFTLPGDAEAGDSFSLDLTVWGYSVSASDATGSEAGRTCQVIPTIEGMSATGTVTITTLGDRATGTFSGTFRNESELNPCTVTIIEGRFDAALNPVPPGEYVAP